MKNQLMYNIVVAQSGGPTAAINASLEGVFSQAQDCSEIDRIYGSINGIEGVLNNNFVDLKKVITCDHDKELLIKTPSTVLGSCRYKLKDYNADDTDYKKILKVFTENNIKIFFYIGGNDSMDTVMKLDKFFREINSDIKVIGVPKTIDNDLMVTDHTPGFGSAVKYIATSIQEIIRDSRVYSIPSVTIVEIMGRDTGWLTASTCILRANGEPAPHMIYLPEMHFSVEKFLDDINNAFKKYRAVIIAVSEGVTVSDDADGMSGFSSQLTDAFGHKYLSGIGKYLEKVVSSRIGCKVRSIELNVMQRCSSHIASLTDLNESEEIGMMAVNAAVKDGLSGKVMVFKRIGSQPYRVDIIPHNIEDVANKVRYFPTDWISNGNDITTDAIDYFLPLIKGEVQTEYINGLPVHFRLNV